MRKRELLEEGDGLLDAVEQLLLRGEPDVPHPLACRVSSYAARLGWKRSVRDALHAHEVILAVQGEVLDNERRR